MCFLERQLRALGCLGLWIRPINTGRYIDMCFHDHPMCRVISVALCSAAFAWIHIVI